MEFLKFGVVVALMVSWMGAIGSAAVSAQAPEPPPPAPPPAEGDPQDPPADTPEAVAGEAELEDQAAIDAVSEPVEEPMVLEQGDDIVVTGSRLRRTAFSTSAPVMVVKREDLDRNAYGSLSDLARNLSEGGGNTSGGGTTGAFYDAQGVQMINLRGLGANATLVLLNGRRLIANGPGGALESFTDISMIPVSMIERIEILRGGASAIYGSDAVAGVVNIITRKKIDGVHLEANALTTEEFDYQEYAGTISAGASNDTSSINVGLNWYHSTPLQAADRDWTAGQFWSSVGPMGLYVPVARAPALGPMDPTNPGAFAADIGFFELFPDPGCPDPRGFLHNDHTAKIAELNARKAMLPPDADERVAIERQLSAYNLGQRFQGTIGMGASQLPYLSDYKNSGKGWWPTSYPDPADPRNQQAVDWDDANGFGCSYNTNHYQVLKPELTRISTMMTAQHDLSKHVQLQIESQYANNRTKRMMPPPAYYRDGQLRPGYYYDLGDNSTPWTASITRPSDGMAIPQTSLYSLWYGYAPSYYTPASVSRYESQTFRGVVALRGDFAAAAKDTVLESWDWELATTYARSTWNTRMPSFQTNDVQRALDACRVDPTTGMLVATGLEPTLANRQAAGCFNPYISAAYNPDAANAPGLIDDLITEFSQLIVTELYTADANLRGEIVPLPGGPLSFAVGGQYRYETRGADYDNDTNQNRIPAGGIDDTSNSRGIWSAYAELSLPFIDGVELQPAVRYESYEGVGGAFSPRVGAVISVGEFFDQPPAAFSGLHLRGSWARAFRAPNLAQSDPDACSFATEDIYSPRAHPDPITRRATRTQLLNGKICGSSELVPEESTSYSAGVDWNWGNMRVTADYWQYDYTERIIQPVMQRAIDRNANRAYCLVSKTPPEGTSMRGQSLLGTLSTMAATEAFKAVDCDAVAAEEGIARDSLTVDQFLADPRFGEVKYNEGTGNPEQGETVLRYTNASEVSTRGIDVAFEYRLNGRTFGSDADIGTFGIGIQGSYVLDFLYRETAANPAIDCSIQVDDASCERDAAGQRNVQNFNDVMPRLKFSAPVTYAYGSHSFAFISRYIGGFEDDGETYDPFNPPSMHIPAWVVFDVQYALNLGGVLGTPAAWRIGVQNLFDNDPARIRQRDAGGFEPSLHDSRGRMLYTRVEIDL
jgi:outer membrane receptor protein involved in Fe transport